MATIFLIMFFVAFFMFIIYAEKWLAAERKADRLESKYRRTKAELNIARMELNTIYRRKQMQEFLRKTESE